jgi:Transposase DNA-binding/Transposase Tn5 dimerisation domain
MQGRSEAEVWAAEQFGDARLGDARRTSRFVRMIARAAESPSGKLSEVFNSSRELDAAYDFVERDDTSVARLQEAVGRATALESVGPRRVLVATDGSSANVVDGTGEKGFGRVGTDAAGARGLKVITALAVGADGVPIGILAQSWWARPQAPQRSQKQKRKDRGRKKPDQKETRYWLQTIDAAAQRLEDVEALGWFQLDREADAWPMLLKLSHSGHWFTVRSAWDRVIESTGRDKQYLRAHMAASRAIGSYELDVPASGARRARQAHMVMHAAEVTLRLRDKRTDKLKPLRVRVVWVHEVGTTPSGEKPLDWMLLTNAPIDTVAAARQVVLGYSMRWRIEEFHKTWKSGACNVERTQLRSRNAVIRWATILAVVAVRIERLKRLGRTEPERPASDELTPVEIEVLLALKRRRKKRTESVPDRVPTMAQAVRWLADLGGYTGKSSGGPPGSITIRRGLERVMMAVEGVLAMREAAG